MNLIKQIKPDLTETRFIGALKRDESIAKVDAVKITEDYKGTLYKISMNGVHLFDLKATDFGVIAIPSENVSPDAVKGYNFMPVIGQFKPVMDAARLEIKKISSDDRGTIQIVLFKGRELYNLLATNAGKARGGHNHDKNVIFQLVFGGPVEWHIQDEVGNWSTKTQLPSEIVEVQALRNHYVVSLGPSLKSEIPRDGVTGNEFQANNDPASRSIVDAINKKEA